MSFYFLDLLYTANAFCAAGLSILSLAIYSSKRFSSGTPLAPLFPLSSTLGGIALYHSFSLYSIPCIAILLGIYGITKKRTPLQLGHALCCALSVIAMLSIDGQRFTQKYELLKSGSHTLEGLVVDKRTWSHAKNGYALTIALDRIDHASTSGTFKIFTYTMTPLTVGDRAIFFKTTASGENQKEKLLSYALREGHVGTCFTPHIRARIFRERSLYGAWLAWWHEWRDQLYTQFELILPKKVFTYFSALFFGNKNRTDFLDLRAKFSRWGLTHYLARSGLHISLLVSLWASILRILPLPLPAKGLILCCVLFLYDRLSWSSISFNRALWLWFFYLGTWLLNNTAVPVFGLANLALSILLFNPWQAGCLDFQLSFFLTMILMLYGYYKPQLFLLSSCFSKKK